MPTQQQYLLESLCLAPKFGAKDAAMYACNTLHQDKLTNVTNRDSQLLGVL